MINKLRESWLYIVTGIGAVISILAYIFLKRGSKIDELNAKIDLATTEKKADILEVEIKHLQTNKDNIQKEQIELDKSLQNLQTKRVEIKEEVTKMTDPNKIVTYWNNN